jgi:hypothetical protein
MEVIESIASHSRDIWEYMISNLQKILSDLGEKISIELSSGRLLERDTTIDEQRLCDLLKTVRSLSQLHASSDTVRGTNFEKLTQLWEFLDKELIQYDGLHGSEESITPTGGTLSRTTSRRVIGSPHGAAGGDTTSHKTLHHGIRRLFSLIEAFMIDHDDGPFSPSVRHELVDFCDKHRRPLNALIRESPDLLFGSFSSIVAKSSRILDFDNKRRYFRK